jgi:(R,R)-butanediol dehydrogenase/meso-butanediol dehydrogenase/diacetyl reductase
MRAAVMRGNAFALEERPDPTPRSGDVVVRVKACGICGSDLHYFHHAPDIIEMARGLGAPVEEMERSLAAGPILGHEFVCEIEDFGPDTQRTLRKGQAVVSMPFVLRDGAPVLVGSSPEIPGAFSEYMLLSESLLLPVSEDVPTQAAALTEPVGIAVHAVNKAELRDTDVAIVVGCGPVGLAIIAVLKARGVRHIVASDLSAKRRELAGIMGATVVVDAKGESVIAAAATAAPGATTLIFENTGARGMLHRLTLEAPAQSRIIVVGIAAGEESFLPMVAITKEISFRFVIYYTAEEFAEGLSLVSKTEFPWQHLITGTVGLTEVTQAFHDLEDAERHAKILIDPWTQ